MIRVLIVSSVRLISDLLETVLKNEKDMQVIGYASNVEEAIQQKSVCDLVLISASMPNEKTIELIQALSKAPNAPQVIVYGATNSEPVLAHYLEVGAQGCVCSEDSVDQLLHTIRTAARHGIALSPKLANFIAQRVAELAEKCRQSEVQTIEYPDQRTLTEREREVLQLIAQGYRNHEIAKSLAIELGTAKNHVHNILDKLKVTTRQDAVAYWSLVANR